MVTPVTSLGSRSGVNWIRELVPCTVSARARASEVFPVPGKSSSSRCPSASRQVTASPIGRGLPRTAWPTLATSLPNVSANQDACSGVMLILPSQQLVSVADVAPGRTCAHQVIDPVPERPPPEQVTENVRPGYPYHHSALTPPDPFPSVEKLTGVVPENDGWQVS